MAMKKKLIVGITAALVTAMCLGGSAFAAGESVSVNGSGTTATKEGQTEVKMDNTPVWSVTIPKTIDFGSISITSSNLKQDLNYTAVIDNQKLTGAQSVASLKISLPATKNTMALNDATHGINIAEAFSILNTGGAEVTKSDTADSALIATLTEANPSATAYAQLNRDKFKDNSSITANSTHAFSGSFSILVTPVAGTN